MRENGLPPAGRGFAHPKQSIELAMLDALHLIGRIALVDHAAALHHIGHAIAHPGIGRLTVAPGAAGFLIIGLDRSRQVHMRHIAHIGLVDPHAESHRSNQAQPFILQERSLVGRAQFGTHPGMIGQGADALIAQPIGDVLDLGAAQAIDDAARAFVSTEEVKQLLARLFPLDD